MTLISLSIREDDRSTVYAVADAIVALRLLGPEVPFAQEYLGRVAHSDRARNRRDVQTVLERFPTTEAAREFLRLGAPGAGPPGRA